MAQINKSSDYFNTKLYTGTGATHNVTGVGFQPDWVWINNRTGTYATTIFDAVRGATKFLEPAGTAQEQTFADTLTSFDSDGFTLGADSSSFCNRGSSPNSYVAWNWLASNTTASNTDGSITSTVSASTTSGFSIVSYTGNGTAGATIGHGLGAVPKMIIIKRRSAIDNWTVYHSDLGGGNNSMFLESTDAKRSDLNMWNSTTPSSSVVTIGNRDEVNNSGSTYIAYCFAEKKGFSKFGSYQGSSGNSFIYTGFKPAFLLVKSDSYNLGNWRIFDNRRSTSGANVIDDSLRANTSGSEIDETSLDFLSNGFKYRGNVTDADSGGTSYIYMAFAESPLVGTNNTPATAR